MRRQTFLSMFFFAGAVSAALPLTISAQSPADDPFIWLEEVEGTLRLTELGLQRYATLERPAKWASETGSQDVSRLLTERTKPDGSNGGQPGSG